MGKVAPDIWIEKGGRRSEFEKNEDNEKKDKIRTCGENGPRYMEKRGVGAPNSKKKDT